MSTPVTSLMDLMYFLNSSHGRVAAVSPSTRLVGSAAPGQSFAEGERLFEDFPARQPQQCPLTHENEQPKERSCHAWAESADVSDRH